jgi:hypothetical protein
MSDTTTTLDNATTTTAESRYVQYCKENNVTLLQGFVRNDLNALVRRVTERDEVKLGEFVQWCIAVGVNASNLTDDNGNPMRYDLTLLTPRPRKQRETVADMRKQLAAMQAELAALRAAPHIPTPPTVMADAHGAIIAK